MNLQSIRRTPVPGVPQALDDPGYHENWPEWRQVFRLVEDSLPSAAQETIAVVDSGVPNAISGGQASTRQAGGNPRADRDEDDHATFLIATMHGSKRPQRRNSTARPIDIKISPFKFFGAQGWPKAKHGAKVIQRASTIKPRVILLAWDVGYTTRELENEIRKVYEQAVVVIAAGNWSLDNDKYHNWPANYGREMEHVITVMATDQHDERASYSSYGKESVFIAAPGYARVDAVGRSSTLRTVGSLRDSSVEFRGTSAAAAYVARLAALVRAKHPTMSPKEVKQHIGETGRDVSVLAERCATGRIVDFKKALR